MTKLIEIFKYSTGLNVKVDSVRTTFNMEKGVCDLTSAFNVEVDDTGRVCTRKGITSILSGDYKSLFSYNDDVLFVRGGNLYHSKSEFSPRLLLSSLNPIGRMRYLGLNGKIYYCDGYINGIFEGGAVSPWVKVERKRIKEGDWLESPPVGHILEFYKSSIYIAKENYVYRTAKVGGIPDYTCVNMGEFGEFFSSKVTMVAGVDNGLYISDEEGLYFLEDKGVVPFKGTPLSVFKRSEKLHHKVIEGTDIKCTNLDIPALQGMDLRGVDGKIVIFTTTAGICLGLGDGRVINITEEKMSKINARFGSAYIINGKYVVSLES